MRTIIILSIKSCALYSSQKIHNICSRTSVAVIQGNCMSRKPRKMQGNLDRFIIFLSSYSAITSRYRMNVSHSPTNNH